MSRSRSRADALFSRVRSRVSSLLPSRTVGFESPGRGRGVGGRGGFDGVARAPNDIAALVSRRPRAASEARRRGSLPLTPREDAQRNLFKNILLVFSLRHQPRRGDRSAVPSPRRPLPPLGDALGARASPALAPLRPPPRARNRRRPPPRAQPGRRRRGRRDDDGAGSVPGRIPDRHAGRAVDDDRARAMARARGRAEALVRGRRPREARRAEDVITRRSLRGCEIRRAAVRRVGP